MDPEERRLVERSLRLSEENNKILKKLERRARWAMLWGVVKIAIIVVPVVAGYIYLQPFIKDALDNYSGFVETFNFR